MVTRDPGRRAACFWVKIQARPRGHTGGRGIPGPGKAAPHGAIMIAVAGITMPPSSESVPGIRVVMPP